MMEWISEQIGVSTDTISKIVATLVTFAVLVLGRWIILRALARAFSEDWDEYRLAWVICRQNIVAVDLDAPRP